MFLPIVALLVLLSKPKHRYLVLLIANYVFYGWNNLAAVPVLLISTVWTYLGGAVLEKHRKRLWYGLFFTGNLLILIFYKYTDFLILSVGRSLSAMMPGSGAAGWNPMNLAVPIGLSFYIFQSSSYLGDVYRKGMAAEHNLLRYASFVSFFPTILSGPIQRSRDLLPQLRNPRNPSQHQIRRGFLLLLWGICEKLLVANQLSVISTSVFASYETQTSIRLLLAAVCFSLYIYSDFSSYSDMACGIAGMLGFEVRTNFRNPYLAESLSDFWNRWHMSLNTWFIENIYIPLGGSRRGALRKYFNIMVVFLVSGLWHGASWHFVVWGLLNGLLRVGGEILAPFRRKIWAALHVNTESASMRFLRRACVFALITMTWLFFTLPGTAAAVEVLTRILAIRPVHFADPTLMELAGSAQATMMLIFSTAVFAVVQYQRREEGKFYTAFAKQPVLVQYLCIAVSVTACILVAMSNPAAVNTQFIYFQF